MKAEKIELTRIVCETLEISGDVGRCEPGRPEGLINLRFVENEKVGSRPVGG